MGITPSSFDREESCYGIDDDLDLKLVRTQT